MWVHRQVITHRQLSAVVLLMGVVVCMFMVADTERTCEMVTARLLMRLMLRVLMVADTER